MKLGIYGGTFDPIHLGHLILAETCRISCQLDEVIFVPTFQSPFKAGQRPATGKHRAEMIEFAISGSPEFRVDRREIRSEQVCYTVETLASFREEYPEDDLFFLMGGDSLVDFPNWREPERILEMAQVVAVNREGSQSESLVDQVRSQFPETLRERVQLATIPSIGISSSEIRERVRQNFSIRFLTPKPVERYIVENELYLDTPNSISE